MSDYTWIKDEESRKAAEQFSAAVKEAEKVVAAAEAATNSRAEFINYIMTVVGEMVDSAEKAVRPEWTDCDCGISGCGFWEPVTKGEKRMVDDVFSPIKNGFKEYAHCMRMLKWEDGE